ncbi:SH3KBP1-binding protein 1 [Seminavis robusta]|uniref:SH3KBP1-binding protein 1 n=1 Tax=Seminavis robusta TaxID=568900 RepID=A0A9N8HNN2_9STRA|nr:SH3KBP1-binding protein 1 [Seminavis robusta]|eukprot:Sro835_g208820.1 SH3KBP1-binding protein 1 (335) ;mRNA; r:17036-18116
MEDLEKTLKSLPELLRQREEALAEREREVKKLQQDLEKEHPNLGKPSDVLRLNVGGRRIDVLRRTLIQVEGSMLESRFSGRWDDGLDKDVDGIFFIDQPPDLFLMLVDFLRAKQTETPLAKLTKPPQVNCGKDEEDFKRIVEYYGVTLAVYPIGLYRLEEKTTPTSPEWGLCGQGECNIEAQEWTTFALRPLEDCHVRYIESYEVTIEPSSNAQVGWISSSDQNMPQYRSSESGRGVGYGSRSMALDCVKACVAVGGATHNLSSSVALGTDGTCTCTIRSENHGNHWYIDGRLVASTSKKGGNVSEFTLNDGNEWIPALSIKGNCRISKIELQL